MYRKYPHLALGLAAAAMALAVSLPTARAGTADDQFAVAATHYAKSRWQLAEEEFRKFVDQFPESERIDEARFFLAESMVQLSRHEEAREVLAELVERKAPGRYAAQASFRFGETAYLLGDTAGAKDALERFLSSYPQDQLGAFALYYLGNIALGERDWPAAQKTFSRALADFPDGAMANECRFGLAQALRSLGELQEARRFYRYLTERKSSPLADDALLELGLLEFNAENYTQAALYLTAIERDFPASDLSVQAYYWRGRCLMAQNRWRDAADLLLREAPRDASDPLAPASAFAAADSLRHCGQLDAAGDLFDRVVREWPVCEWADDALESQVQLALDAGRYDRVDELAARFERQFPASPLLAAVRQASLRSLLDREEFDKAAALAAHPATTDEAEATSDDADDATLYYLALAHIGARRYQQALDVLDRLEARVSARRPASERATSNGNASVAPANDDANEDDELSLDIWPDGSPGNDDRHDDASPEPGEMARDAASPSPSAEADPTDDWTAALLAARASALLGLKRNDESIQALQEYLRRWPNRPEAVRCRAQLCVALSRDGRLDQALTEREVLRSAAATAVATPSSRRNQSPDSDPFLDVTLHLAEAAYSSGQRQTAERLFGELAASKGSPRYAAQGLAGLGWCRLDTSDLDESAAAFARLLDQFPDSPLAAEAALMRARALEGTDNPSGAIAMYDLIIERHPHSEQMADALWGAARLHDRLEQDQDAARLLKRLIDEHPDFAAIDAAIYQYAWVLSDLGKKEESVLAFERVARNYRNGTYWPDSMYRLAHRAAEDGDHERAAILLDEVLDATPKGEVLAHALYLKGQLAAAQDDWDQVAQPMQRVVDEFPDSPLRMPAEYWLADSLYRQERYDEAGRRFAQLAQEMEGRNDSWLGLVVLRQAQTLAQEQRWQEAHDLAGTIAERFPDFNQPHEVDYLLGRCLASLGQFDEARQAYERVTRSSDHGRSETAAMAQWMIGESFFHQQRYEEAIRAYHRVEALYAYPRWQAGALLQAGKCHEMLGQWQQATELYDEVTKAYPNTPFTEEAGRRLNVTRQRMNLSAARQPNSQE